MVAPSNPQAAVDQTLKLLKARDDTSRFVGLSLLRSLLDSNEQLRTDDENLLKCWNAISNKFLLRLLRTQETESKSKDEARDMVELAVAVIHIFANLLPALQVGGKKMVEFCEPLLTAILRLESDSRKHAFQVLQCVASTSSGAVVLAEITDWKPIIDTASSNDDVLIDLIRLQRAADKSGSLSGHQQGRFASVVSSAILGVRDRGNSDSIETLEALGELTSETSVRSDSFSTVSQVSLLICKVSTITSMDSLRHQPCSDNYHKAPHISRQERVHKVSRQSHPSPSSHEPL